MTCAPRGIFSTYSASVGRTATSFVPSEVRTVTPSCCPRIAACGTTPACEWKLPPSVSVTRCRRRFASTSSTPSPAVNGGRMALLAFVRPDADGDVGRADTVTQPAERADIAGGRRSAHEAGVEELPLLLGVVDEAVVRAVEEPEQERGLGAGR